MKHYAIEKIEGKKERFILREISDNMIISVTGKVWRTEEAAKNEAENLNIKVEKISDFYGLL
jgi:hypothetical protein